MGRPSMRAVLSKASPAGALTVHGLGRMQGHDAVMQGVSTGGIDEA